MTESISEKYVVSFDRYSIEVFHAEGQDYYVLLNKEEARALMSLLVKFLNDDDDHAT